MQWLGSSVQFEEEWGEICWGGTELWQGTLSLKHAVESSNDN